MHTPNRSVHLRKRANPMDELGGSSKRLQTSTSEHVLGDLAQQLFNAISPISAAECQPELRGLSSPPTRPFAVLRDLNSQDIYILAYARSKDVWTLGTLKCSGGNQWRLCVRIFHKEHEQAAESAIRNAVGSLRPDLEQNFPAEVEVVKLCQSHRSLTDSVLMGSPCAVATLAATAIRSLAGSIEAHPVVSPVSWLFTMVAVRTFAYGSKLERPSSASQSNLPRSTGCNWLTPPATWKPADLLQNLMRQVQTTLGLFKRAETQQQPLPPALDCLGYASNYLGTLRQTVSHALERARTCIEVSDLWVEEQRAIYQLANKMADDNQEKAQQNQEIVEHLEGLVAAYKQKPGSDRLRIYSADLEEERAKAGKCVAESEHMRRLSGLLARLQVAVEDFNRTDTACLRARCDKLKADCQSALTP